jgi:hypothetical protein
VARHAAADFGRNATGVDCVSQDAIGAVVELKDLMLVSSTHGCAKVADLPL